MENWLEGDGHSLTLQIVLIEVTPFNSLLLASTGLPRGHRGWTGGRSLSLAVASRHTLWGPLWAPLARYEKAFSPIVAKSAALLDLKIGLKNRSKRRSFEIKLDGCFGDHYGELSDKHMRSWIVSAPRGLMKFRELSLAVTA